MGRLGVEAGFACSGATGEEEVEDVHWVGGSKTSTLNPVGFRGGTAGRGGSGSGISSSSSWTIALLRFSSSFSSSNSSSLFKMTVLLRTCIIDRRCV